MFFFILTSGSSIWYSERQGLLGFLPLTALNISKDKSRLWYLLMRFFSVQYFRNLVTRHLNFLNEASCQAHGYIYIMAFYLWTQSTYLMSPNWEYTLLICIPVRKEIRSSICINNYKRVNLYPLYIFLKRLPTVLNS